MQSLLGYQAMTEKICEACKKDFTCGADAGPCWCEGVSLSAATLAGLRERYTNCLCPKCLGAIANGQTPKSKVHT